MTSEEIIQRLLDERKITVKEAMILLKDIIDNSLRGIFKKQFETQPTYPRTYDVVMYGVATAPYQERGNTEIESQTIYTNNGITYSEKKTK